MQITQLRGKKWAIGLDWEILPGELAIKQEAKDVAQKTNCNYGLLVDYDGQFAIGLSQKSSKEPSAALYLALANQERRSVDSLENYPDWVVVEDVGDDKYWMGVIKNGIPAPQFDAVFDITTIKEKFGELIVNDTYKFYSPCGEIVSLFDGVKFVESKSLNDLTASVKTKIKYDKLRGIPMSFIYGAIGIAILGFLIVTLSTFIEGRNLREKANSIKNKQAEQARQEKAKYDADVKNYNEQMQKLKSDAVQSVLLGLAGTPSSILSSWYNAVSSHEFGTHGWDLQNIECYYNPRVVNAVIPQTGQEFACDFQFARNGLTTNRMFLQDYPDATISGNTALLTKILVADRNFLVVPDASILQTIPNSKGWGFDMISQLQLLKIVQIDYDVKASTDVTFQGLPEPVSPEDKAKGKTATPGSLIPIGYSKGEIVVKSKNFELLKEVADNVDFKAVGVKKLVMKLQGVGEIAWDLTLNYYVKSDTGGIVASSSSGLSNSSVKAEGTGAAPTPLGPTGK